MLRMLDMLRIHRPEDVAPQRSDEEEKADCFIFPCMARGNLIEEALTRSIIGAFFETYNALGYGLLEHVCALALERELIARGHYVMREVGIQTMYKGQPLATQRNDLVVDERVIVEIKSTETLHGSANRQLYNYLRATNMELGLLLHFGPKARFWRVLYRPRSNNPKHIEHPKHAYSQSTCYSPDRAAVGDWPCVVPSGNSLDSVHAEHRHCTLAADDPLR